jgi:uncharacterized protein (TIGR04141 family)
MGRFPSGRDRKSLRYDRRVPMAADEVRVPLQRLHVRLLKHEVASLDAAIEDPGKLHRYELKRDLGFGGRLYLSPPKQGPPPWLEFVQTGLATRLEGLTNRTNAAVLLIKRHRRMFAFTFGHGRHLLGASTLEPGFGLRTALNGLRHDSLRSIDSFTVEDRAVHTRAQASRASGIEVFGLDVGRDILRAVTGLPRPDVPLHNLTGSEATLVISARVDFAGLGSLCDELARLYRKQSYKEHFAWVDNLRRVRDPSVQNELDDVLLAELRKGTACEAYIAPPEPIDWARVDGFEYTRRRAPREHDLSIQHYLSVTDLQELDVDRLKRDKVFVYSDGLNTPKDEWPVYKCLVFEVPRRQRRYVLVNGDWFELDRDFASQVRRIVAELPVAQISLPPVQHMSDGGLEPEARYNQRVARRQRTTALLDGKTARCRAVANGIEPCDLLTSNLDLIHVKHRKGGSSSLSHLFAQGRIAAEALVGDEDFRQDVRDLLRDLRPGWERRVPPGRPSASSYRVVFAILGVTRQHPGEDLPFFSQLNLARTGEALQNLGFRVGVCGVRVARTVRGGSG